MTRHYSDLDSASDWMKQISPAVRPIRTITQIWVLTRHQYGISAFVSQTSFRGETSGGVAKCRLFSQSILLFVTRNLYQFQCFLHTVRISIRYSSTLSKQEYSQTRTSSFTFPIFMCSWANSRKRPFNP